MAFALFSVFELFIVKHIYELAKEPDTLDVKVIFYPGPWATRGSIASPCQRTQQSTN